MMIYRLKFPADVLITTTAKCNLPLVARKPGKYSAKYTQPTTTCCLGKTTYRELYLRRIGECVLVIVIYFNLMFFAGYGVSALQTHNVIAHIFIFNMLD